MIEDMEVEEARPKKMQSIDTQNECLMFVMTPEMARRAKEYCHTPIFDLRCH